MKKTYNINLNGQVFCIDEDAYTQLHAYIETLERYYLKEEEGKEIMADIESRIGELFREALQKQHKEVISLTDIGQVIGIMGTPDAIIDEDREYTATEGIKRKLYRDTENQVFGGVAAGIAAYLGIPVLWIRLTFALLTFFYGITLLVYLVLWLALPKAVTAKQKLEMKGESINVSNLERNIRNTYQEVKEKTKLQNFLNGLARGITEFSIMVGDILVRILSVLLSVLAVIGILACSGMFLFFLGAILFSSWVLPEHYTNFLQCTFSTCALWSMKVIALLIVEIPLFLIIYYCSARLFRFQTRKAVLLISGCLWILACIGGVAVGFYQSMHFSQQYYTQNEHPLMPTEENNKLLHVKFKLNNSSEIFRTQSYGSDNYLYYAPLKTDSALLYLKPQLYISETTAPWPSLEIKKEARGFSMNEAARNIETIEFGYQWKNDTLLLNDFFTLNRLPWRSNRISLKLSVPEGYQVNFIQVPGEELVNRYIFKKPYHPHRHPFIQGTYIMQDNRLVRFPLSRK